MTAQSLGGASPVSHSRHQFSVAAPYRLDFTVSALRRLSTNIVDVLTPEGHYIRALDASRGPVVAHVVQTSPQALTVRLDAGPHEHKRALALIKRMLGTDRDLSHFNRAAASIPWLRPLARRMRGVKPPRYPTLWEACVNAVAFQHVSLIAASAIMRRVIAGLGQRVESDGIELYVFPTAESFLSAEDKVLRTAGLSLSKLSTLRRVAEALEGGRLDEAMLEERASPDAAMLLREIKGIGPWTATLILLRGLGRLDVFPMNDTSVALNLALASKSDRIDIDDLVHALSPQQGMLYYHLLLARLEVRDDLGRASVSGQFK